MKPTKSIYFLKLSGKIPVSFLIPRYHLGSKPKLSLIGSRDLKTSVISLSI